MVAVSGGADSVALLHLLLEWRLRTTPFAMAVTHLNHGIRGADSREDAAFVARLAARHDLPLLAGDTEWAAGAADSPIYNDAPSGLPSEDHLRQARRAFFAEKARIWGATHLFLGHTRDDQAETAILNLLRGSGSRGLGGIRAQSRLGQGPMILRPLLDISREDLRGWLNEQKLTWREDHTNTDPRYLRNRVRAQLMPVLEDLRPGARETLARAAALVQDDDDLLTTLATTELHRLTTSSTQSKGNTAEMACAKDSEKAADAAAVSLPLTLDGHALAALPRALARRVIRLAATQGTIPPPPALSLSGTASEGRDELGTPLPVDSGPAAAARTSSELAPVWAPGARQVEAVLDMAATGRGGSIDLGGGHTARLKQGQLTFKLVGDPGGKTLSKKS